MNARLPDDHPAEWMIRAHSDLTLAELALSTPGVLLEDACFHIQQSVEKALKGWLVAHQKPFQKTHDIGVLVKLVDESGSSLPEDLIYIDDLTVYAVQTRYPGLEESVDREEAEHAFQLAVRLVEWVEKQLRG